MPADRALTVPRNVPKLKRASVDSAVSFGGILHWISKIYIINHRKEIVAGYDTETSIDLQILPSPDSGAFHHNIELGVDFVQSYRC